ncbi:hypothetical protein NERG_01494 [Nematocida ausubeli]|uniref:Uncharacterized protein n=1 Tax=Nematocida ausubeli (strain ATCC PRA-371 / ERTm2) TaxID=1913371 RepID=H8ZCQ1_NEMA1|nr:hypothetical protein NERG_01494 [Nematocida ausubeli]
MKSRLQIFIYLLLIQCAHILAFENPTSTYVPTNVDFGLIVLRKTIISIRVYIPSGVAEMYRDHEIEIAPKVIAIFKIVENGINRTLKNLRSEKYYSLHPIITIVDSNDPRIRTCPNSIAELSLFLSNIYNLDLGATSFIFITLCPLAAIRAHPIYLPQKHFYISQGITGTHNTMNIILSEVDHYLLVNALARAILKACDLYTIEPLAVHSLHGDGDVALINIRVLKETAHEMLLKEYLGE